MLGQERYAPFLKFHSRGTSGVMLCYAVDDRKSFEHIAYWMKEIKSHRADDEICIYLVGMKSDVPGRVVDVKEGRKYADFYGIKFFEVNMKEDLNINGMFLTLAEDILDIIERKKEGVQARISTKNCGYCNVF